MDNNFIAGNANNFTFLFGNGNLARVDRRLPFHTRAHNRNIWLKQGHGLALLRATGEWSRRYFSAPDEIVEKELIAAMGRVLPRIHGAALFTQLLRDPRAVPAFEVGRYREIADFLRVQRHQRAGGRRLYFAGDYRLGPGWDAALRSGMRTATAVAEDLG